MQLQSLSRTIKMFAISTLILCAGQKSAFSQFDVDWGVSYDNGQTGYFQIAEWLVNNGYYGDMGLAENFAVTGYIGFDSGDADPYFWNLAQPFSVEIVQEIAAFADLNTFGYYTGSGASKTHTQLFGPLENGPVTLSLAEPFGFFISTPQLNNWYTDRAENEDHQFGFLHEPGGNAQGLIYELSPGTEWLIAWEDKDASKIITDRDYNDMWVKVTLAPEPLSGALFLLGAGMLTVVRMRKKV